MAVMRLAEGWGTAEDVGAESPEGMGREARVEEVMAPEEGEPIEQLCDGLIPCETKREEIGSTHLMRWSQDHYIGRL